ncbi:hypothetical protein COLSTE_00487 [Collinsella stercoris DSM 13279]|uniref:Uncharacterized protein n=1 Tax=Collinsella stercoris DSM 13279 TaxID=445975 RepID=B6G8U6_9ACTN|nr:hypothetical protein COLSTE_00487 [Collinsella stercoris DSM 13279]
MYARAEEETGHIRQADIDKARLFSAERTSRSTAWPKHSSSDEMELRPFS